MCIQHPLTLTPFPLLNNNSSVVGPVIQGLDLIEYSPLSEIEHQHLQNKWNFIRMNSIVKIREFMFEDLTIKIEDKTKD